MQRQDSELASKKNNKRKKTTTVQNQTATLQYKPCSEQSTLSLVGSQIYSFVTSTASTLFGSRQNSITCTENPLMRDVKLKIEHEKTKTDLKLEELHTRLEGVLRKDLNSVQEKITEARKNKQPHEDLLKTKRAIRAEMDKIRVEKVKLVPELIREHANRRIDYFFYLCVLVYRTGVIVSKGSTDRQHGDGDAKTGTAACHSCLIPNPVFTPGPGITDTLLTKIPDIIQKLITYFRPEDAGSGLQSDTEEIFIRDTFNSTVILPIIVNKLDNLLEGTVQNPSELVLKALEIANRTSRGDINPLQAMDEFGAAINTYFYGIEKTYNDETLKTKPDTKNPGSLSLALKYQREGTHRVIHATTGKAYRDHFYMLLGVNPRYALIDYPTSFIPGLTMEKYFMALQRELLDPPLIVDKVLPFRAEELAMLNGPMAANRIISIFESYTTRAGLLKEKFSAGKHTPNDDACMQNMLENIRLLNEIVKTLPKSDKSLISKYAKKASNTAHQADEQRNKLDLTTGSQSMLNLN